MYTIKQAFATDKASEFQRIFNRSIRAYWDIINGEDLGLDVSKLAKDLFPDFYHVDKSLAELLEDEYGIKARELVHELLFTAEKQPDYDGAIFKSYPREGAIERDWTNKDFTLGIMYLSAYYAAPKRASIKQKTPGNRIVVCFAFPI